MRPQSFYTIYRNLFARLAQEESLWYEHDVSEYPSFGDSTWAWTASQENKEHAARYFYNWWLSFSTAKDFSWCDHFDVTDAPDRRIRRLMEKENKKSREEARKEYNETVRVCSVNF